MAEDARGPRPLACQDDQPVFAEPWQAEALGLAQALVDGGVVEAGAWAEALGEALRHEPEGSDPREHYYRAVLVALERLMAERAGLGAEDLRERAQAWRRAYLNTPHGHPVDLARGVLPEG